MTEFFRVNGRNEVIKVAANGGDSNAENNMILDTMYLFDKNDM
jgi:hypothetical protein